MEALELSVDEGRPANAGRFFQLGHDLLTLLDELSDVPVVWRVEDLQMGSAVARGAPPPGTEEGRWRGRTLRGPVVAEVPSCGTPPCREARRRSAP